jgi:diguanylate cyclase (GGDEF)-like protein/PAS domain S-box-containing protein
MRLLEAFAASESMVALLNADDGRFVDVNPAFERITGYRRDQVMGKIPVEVGLWPDPRFRAQLWDSLRATRRVVAWPTRLQTADAGMLFGQLNVELISTADGPRLFCLLQEVSEDQLSRLSGQIDSVYRQLFDEAAQGIYRSLPGGGLIDVNPAFARLLGYDTPGEVVLAFGDSARRLYADPVAVDALYRQLREHGRIQQFRAQVRRRDGSRIWVSENSRLIRDDDGTPRFYEGSMEDITAQVESEQALQQAQDLYHTLLDNSRDGVFLVQRGKVRFANQALCDMLGYGADELKGLDYLSLVDPSDQAAQQGRRDAREGGSRELQTFETRMLGKDGRRILCEVRAAAVDFDGDIASTGTVRDVTDERRRQHAIEEAERRYRELFNDSPAGLFRTALDGSIIEVNEMLARMMGYDDAPALRADIGNIMQIYADPALRNMLVERAARDGGFSGMEVQVRARSGALRWVSASVRTDYDHNGRPLSFTGSVLDIDEPQRMRQALQRSESRYRTLVEHSSVGVYLSSRSRLDYVNRALAAMLGYNESDLIGKHYLELLAPEVREQTIDLHNRLRETGELPREHETVFLHSNGQRVYVRVNVLAIEIDGVSHTTGTILDITRQREAESRLRFHATHDPLTGLPNRALFNRRLADRLARDGQRGSDAYAVIFLDLDGFKWVNDSLGHSAGDRLLLEIARRLENDLVRDVLIARYGGDEFTLLPEGPCDTERAVGIARRVLALFEQPFDVSGQQVFSAASLGIVIGSDDYESPDQVLRDADTAMYRAKAAGKSGYVVFDDTMHAEARARLQLETDFRLAFERDEFLLHYQPIVDLEDGRVVGAEALVRWRHPRRGVIAPGEFLTIAEETGLIVDLDTWVLREACRQLADWRQRFPIREDLVLNVNVDERQIASSELVEEVARLLRQHALPAARLRLEVTETVFRGGRGLAMAQLDALKALGVGLAVDDFGTGYSSLESFAASSFDALKVDQTFVRDLASNPRHRAIVRTVISFGQDLGLLLTAEGIETEEQRQMLRESGCRYGQGFLFARPLSPAEFELRL